MSRTYHHGLGKRFWRDYYKLSNEEFYKRYGYNNPSYVLQHRVFTDQYINITVVTLKGYYPGFWMYYDPDWGHIKRRQSMYPKHKLKFLLDNIDSF